MVGSDLETGGGGLLCHVVAVSGNEMQRIVFLHEEAPEEEMQGFSGQFMCALWRKDCIFLLDFICGCLTLKKRVRYYLWLSTVTYPSVS